MDEYGDQIEDDLFVKGFFVEGNFEIPKRWYICDPIGIKGTNPGCETAFNFNDKIFVKYTFRRRLLPHHEAIRKAIEGKIAEWLKEAENG
jgi:hypothetical protein